MTGLAVPGVAGTGILTRLALRRDRIMLPAWVYVITALVAGTAYTFRKVYTPATRAQLLATAGHNPAFLFLYGKPYATSVGALTAWRYGVWASILASLVAIFLVVRHTRADEEAGRMELIAAGVVGRHAPLTVALVVAGIASAVLVVLITAALAVLGLPVAGSAALALAIAASSLAFACIAALAAQIASGARPARGIAAGALGAAYLLRAIGDSAGPRGPSWLSWLSPLGWVEFTRPFAGDRWGVLVLPLALAALAGGAAYAVAARRDYGAGLLPGRPGRPQAGRLLRGPFGLAWRLQRGALAGWAAAMVFGGASAGAAAEGIGSVLGGSAQLKHVFTSMGGQTALTNAYLAALMLMAGLAAGAYGVAAVSRLRAEETGQLAELVLATATGRIRWALSHTTVGAAGSAALLAVAGLATGLGYGLRAGDVGTQVTRLLGAALAQWPAALAVAAAAVVLLGAVPRAAVAGGWTVVSAVVLVAFFGPLLRFPAWLLDISPFTHVPKLPGAPVHPAPHLWLALAAALLIAAGLAALRRRDIG
jgi:ABC-2 type transport system permease protein